MEWRASQDWSSDEWCRQSPVAIVFEWKHCGADGYARALRSLERSSACPAQHGVNATPYRLFAETEENAFFTRVPRRYWQPDTPVARNADRRGGGRPATLGAAASAATARTDDDAARELETLARLPAKRNVAV